MLLELQKPPAPVALQGRLCLSGKPHEYKRSLVWLNLPYPTNWEEPKVRRPPLSISILQRRQGTPPSNLPPPIKISPFSLFVPDDGNVSFFFSPFFLFVSCSLAAMSTRVDFYSGAAWSAMPSVATRPISVVDVCCRHTLHVSWQPAVVPSASICLPLRKVCLLLLVDVLPCARKWCRFASRLSPSALR